MTENDPKMPAAHREIMSIANEAGYFPLPSQLREISISAATIYSQRYPGRLGAIPDDIFKSTVLDALREMNKS